MVSLFKAIKCSTYFSIFVAVESNTPVSMEVLVVAEQQQVEVEDQEVDVQLEGRLAVRSRSGSGEGAEQKIQVARRETANGNKF